MGVTYRFKVGEGPNEKLQDIRDRWGQKGIRFTCNPDGTGSFGGKGLSGSYYREGDEIVLTLISIPPFTSFDDIAERIKLALGCD
jgi:hypothetical protein